MVILHKKVAGLSEGTLERFVLRARKVVGLRAPVNVLVTSRAAMRSLNREFRSQNKETDVLSFPATDTLDSRKRSQLAGEIAISADIALQNAGRLGHPVAQEIKILALHGILHLAGFDHERDNGEMAGKEATCRKLLGLPVALIERVEIERAKPGSRQSSKTRRGTPPAKAARSLA